jgi:hypothetical protein
MRDKNQRFNQVLADANVHRRRRYSDFSVTGVSPAHNAEIAAADGWLPKKSAATYGAAGE